MAIEAMKQVKKTGEDTDLLTPALVRTGAALFIACSIKVCLLENSTLNENIVSAIAGAIFGEIAYHVLLIGSYHNFEKAKKAGNPTLENKWANILCVTYILGNFGLWTTGCTLSALTLHDKYV